MTTQFQVGKTYSTRSICDHNCIHSFNILARAAKMVTVEVSGKIVKRGLSIYDDCEQFSPYGSYSMSAIITAEQRRPRSQARLGRLIVRALIINAEARARAAEIVAHSLAHPWNPGAGEPPPGDDPANVLQLGTYRAVFSFTELESGEIARVLSVSIPTPGKYPSVIAFCVIAELFGLTGWDGRSDKLPDDWWIDLPKGQNCVCVAQPYSSGKATKQ